MPAVVRDKTGFSEKPERPVAPVVAARSEGAIIVGSNEENYMTPGIVSSRSFQER